MATNLDMLLYLKNAIFVDELLTKTRKGGLPWMKLSPDRYTVTVCEPPRCLNPSTSGQSWTVSVTKLLINEDYVYSLDVLTNDHPFIFIDSRDIDDVQMLFSQVETLSVTPVARDTRMNQAISFISNLPSAPTTDLSEFVMCGGLLAGGSAAAWTAFNPAAPHGGAGVGGESDPSVQMFPGGSGGVLVGGDPGV